ncbi:MAG: hypothetical protein AAB931_00155 [Patescibacteria group bacterium]
MANPEILRTVGKIAIVVIDRLGSGYNDKKDLEARRGMVESAENSRRFGEEVASEGKLVFLK